MSEIDATPSTTEESPLIDLTQPEAANTAGEESAKPEVPEWSKLWQKEQEKAANRDRAINQKLDTFSSQIQKTLESIAKGGGTAAQQQSRIEKVAALLSSDKGRELEVLNPGITEILGNMLEEVKDLRANGDTAAKLQAEIKALESEKFWGDYPQDAKDFIEEEQKKILARDPDLDQDTVARISRYALDTYMEARTKSVVESAATKPLIKATQTKAKVITVPGARSSTKGETPEEILRQIQTGERALMPGI